MLALKSNNSAGSVAFFTGDERMRIDGAGNVGIGVTDSAHPLEIKKSNNAALEDILMISNGGGSTGTETGIVFQNGVDHMARISTKMTGSDRGPLKFYYISAKNTLSEGMQLSQDGYLGIGTSSPTESLEVNGRIRGVASVGEIKITGLQTHTQSGTYSFPFSHLSKGLSADFAFDSTNKGLLIKKTGWYHLALTENWDTASVTGRLDVAFRLASGTAIASTIFNTDSTTYDQKEFSAFYEVTSPNTIIYVTYSTSYTVSNFFHACGKFTAYRLN